MIHTLATIGGLLAFVQFAWTVAICATAAYRAVRAEYRRG